MADASEQDPQTGAAHTRPTPLGIYDRPKTQVISGIEIIAIAISAIWLLGAGLFFLMLPSEATEGGEGAGALRFLMTIMAIFMPIGMVWVAASAARASKVMREESQRLQASLDAIRHTYIAQSQNAATGVEPASVARKLDEIAAATRKTETVLATFSSRREQERQTPARAPAPAAVDQQQALALGTHAEDLAPPLDTADFIRALNFPETAEDTQGFAALRRALKDRPSAQLIQAAQDILTLLSQDGIYMDDLLPDRARPEIWRHFGQGVRGRPIAPLGGIRDRSSLALTSGRMKQDPIFRDAAHHFLRLFDKTFAEFEKRADDSDIVALAETRTARAFMLLGRVAGTFD
ncbi:hypothetical protein CEP88_06590 [Roseobacter denitrificans]|uniref:Uncharacterized protein n=1 Tax=Roseobacter denitrificans (strain ATCC 33942 / OCh 114) TaxID=375451 RepID=Q163E5_ROSDO|nr:hypothetical protein [Roseobacter denitrificans]ABG32898.1 hypothetical protein RD1_3406 [Roseobacter denitrificans OCh 114]AVL52291.1 hypothetical protein CEP88_06590 [Roseobacter denitrificans]SFG45555.1 hypothetical protein SAMN05443635_11925 [Roseobacter denitrificans OCh 114]